MHIAADGGVVAVNTGFNCLMTLDPRYSFTPIWRPPFISEIVGEDRCHLNGLAMIDGKPAYVTTFSDSDTLDGWRDHRHDGGLVIDVDSGETVCQGLSMPHSPRWHDGRLWLHNSGTREFGFVDFDAGKFEAIASCPSYLRGLDFVGGHAIVGMSVDREVFESLDADKGPSFCGCAIIDLASGDRIHELQIKGSLISELYDVLVLKDMLKPMALGTRVTPELRNWISPNPGAPS
jgi:uncharacterized protein (TIGR03032 family)